MRYLERRSPNGNLGAPGQKSGAIISDQPPRIWYAFLQFLYIPEDLIGVKIPYLPPYLLCLCNVGVCFTFDVWTPSMGGPDLVIF